MEERRNDPRYPAELPVRIVYEDADEFLAAYSSDISLGGVFLRTDAEMPMGTAIDLTIEMGGGKGFRAKARVAWFRDGTGGEPRGIGLQFTGLTPKSREWLKSSMKAYLSRPQKTSTGLHSLRPAVSSSALVDAGLQVGAEALEVGDDVVLGIDLGTSTSSVCTFVDGKATVLDLSGVGDSPGGSKSIPSVIAYDGAGGVTVGGDAVDMLERNPKRTIYGAKRFIGRRYDHPEVQSMLSRYPYKIVKGSDGRCAIEVNGRPVEVEAVSSKLLTHIRNNAEQHPAINRTVQRAVITVPAYYNQNQRQAVVRAGRLAGLSVDRIINEPTAAAIAYGLADGRSQKILIYDLGGGTFDVSVMTIEGGRMDVLATAGDTFLGGEDFDDVIVNAVCAKFEAASGSKLSRNHISLARIKSVAEQAKRRLSLRDSTMVAVRQAVLMDGSSTRLEVEITRAEVEKLVEPLVTRTLNICNLALTESRLRPGDINDVILVGGQSLMPYVRVRVGAHFDRDPRSNMRADEVVALGAGMLTRMSAQRSAELRDVLSMTIGIAASGGRFNPLIARNTALPAKVTRRLEVAPKDLRTFAVEIYQGENKDLSRNEHLGTLSLAGIEPGPSSPVELLVDFSLSADCLLSVRVTNGATGESADILLNTRD